MAEIFTTSEAELLLKDPCCREKHISTVLFVPSVIFRSVTSNPMLVPVNVGVHSHDHMLMCYSHANN